LPLEQQRAVLEAAGVAFEDQQQPQQQRVVLYCNGGVAACTAALALQRLGLKDWGVYDGSWKEWSRTELPVEVD
jgi:thiosulfate/3-mercaptopyruvate sulfurtransferase